MDIHFFGWSQNSTTKKENEKIIDKIWGYGTHLGKVYEFIGDRLDNEGLKIFIYPKHNQDRVKVYLHSQSYKRKNLRTYPFIQVPSKDIPIIWNDFTFCIINKILLNKLSGKLISEKFKGVVWQRFESD